MNVFFSLIDCEDLSYLPAYPSGQVVFSGGEIEDLVSVSSSSNAYCCQNQPLKHWGTDTDCLPSHAVNIKPLYRAEIRLLK